MQAGRCVGWGAWTGGDHVHDHNDLLLQFRGPGGRRFDGAAIVVAGGMTGTGGLVSVVLKLTLVVTMLQHMMVDGH